MPLLNPKERRRTFDRLEQKWASLRSDTFHKLRESSFAVNNSMAINVASDRRMIHAAHKDSLADRYLPRTFRKRLETHLDRSAGNNDMGTASLPQPQGKLNATHPHHSSAVTVNFYGIESDDAMQGFMECPKSPDHVLVLKALFSQWATEYGGSAIPLLPLSSVTADIPAVVQRGIEKSIEQRKLNGCGPLHLVPGSNNSEVGGTASDRWGALVFDWLELLDCINPPQRVPRDSVPKSVGGGKKKEKKSKTVLEDSPSFITIADWLVLASCDMCKDWKMIAALRNAYESYRTLVAEKQAAYYEEMRMYSKSVKRNTHLSNDENGFVEDDGDFMQEPPKVLAIDLIQFMEATLCQLINEGIRKAARQKSSEDIYSDDDEDEGASAHINDNDQNGLKEEVDIPPPPISPRPPSATSPSAALRRPASASGHTPRVARGSSYMSVPTSITGIHLEQHTPRNVTTTTTKKKKKKTTARKPQIPLQRERTAAKLFACGLCPIDPEEWKEVERRNSVERDINSRSPRQVNSTKASNFATPKRPTSSPASGRAPHSAVASDKLTDTPPRAQSSMTGEGYTGDDFEEESDGETKPRMELQNNGIPPSMPEQPVPAVQETTQSAKEVKLDKPKPLPPVLLPLSFSTCLLLLLPHRVKMYLVKSTVRVYPNATNSPLDAEHSEDDGNSAHHTQQGDMDRKKQAAAFDPRGASRFYGAVTPGAREAVIYYRQVMAREGGPDSKVPKSTTAASQRIQTFVPKTKIDITKRETRDLRYARKIWS